MAASSFDAALARLLAHEGGYSNHPADPGGPTKFGITLAVYRRYVKPNATATDVRAMSADEAKAIYRAHYWNAMRCDELPAGVDYAVFDYGVNSGIRRATRAIQRLVGVTADGVLGPHTVAEVARWNANGLITAICDERLRFLRGLRTWPVFGKGWTRRVADVREAALAMAGSPDGAQRNPGRAFPHSADAPCGRREQGAPFSSTVLATKGDPIMWAKIKTWFNDSETIFWARLQIVIGSAVATVMAVAADPSINAAIQAVLKPAYVPYYIIAFGLLTEVLRRRRATDL